jgi:hypothetical protein
MSRTWRITAWVGAALGCAVVIAGVLLARHHKPVVLTGAVLVWDQDARKQLPLEGAEVTEANGLAQGPSKSDSQGMFRLKLEKGIRRGQAVTLEFRHPDYHPLELKDYAGDKLYIARMAPIQPPNASIHPTITVENVRVRYSSKAVRTVNVGSAVKAFQVENNGDTPCPGNGPCSPDGKWMATIGSTSLDAGPGNEFRKARASCIAGPCAFTKIEKDDFSRGGQTISVSVRNWSDTVTYLLEAEVVHSMISPIEHESYPVIFGRGLNFTLPSSAEGVSIEADINGETIVFPLGPALFLSWASCDARLNQDQTKIYRCGLKPEYRFR